MTIQELVALANEVEGRGVPVDWKAVAFRVMTAAQARIEELDEELATQNALHEMAEEELGT